MFAFVLAVLCAFLLTGCLKINSDLKISKDLLLTGTLSYQIDKTAFDNTGIDPQQQMDENVSELQQQLPQGISVERLSDDVYEGVEIKLDKVKPEDFSAFSEDSFGGLLGRNMSITKGDNNTIKFSMDNPVMADFSSITGSGNPFSNPYTGGGGGSASMRSAIDESIVKFTFPGKVISADGADVQGKSATWNLKTYDGETLSAEAKASGFPWVVLFIILGVVILLAIVGGIILLVVMSKKKKSAPPQQPGFPGQFPPGGTNGAGGFPPSGGFGSSPQQGFPQQGGFGSAPQQGFPQQGGFGSAPQQGGFGSAPQQGFGNPGFGSGPSGNPGNSDGRFQPPAPGAY